MTNQLNTSSQSSKSGSPDLCEIEKKHQEIMAMIDNLILALRNDKLENAMDKHIRELGGKVLDCFDREEKCMINSKYTDYDAHKGEHIKFLKNFAVLKRLCEDEGSLDQLSVAIRNQVVEWLTNHITSVDKNMLNYLKSR
ncbi:MAG: hemerythrin family protein [Nitrospirae bacterium]|nr:hemerythrin family protein [Nitrospirota bacterium]MBF0539856.1 hemerythrin family protein [Nitrospirota bacterium]